MRGTPKGKTLSEGDIVIRTRIASYPPADKGKTVYDAFECTDPQFIKYLGTEGTEEGIKSRTEKYVAKMETKSHQSNMKRKPEKDHGMGMDL